MKREYHYTYSITHPTGHFYIGVRSSYVPPAEDTKYWSSSKYLKALLVQIPDGWVKTILGEFKTRDEALKHEYDLTGPEALKNPLCVNRSRGGGAWNEVRTEKHNKAISIAHIGRAKSPEHRASLSRVQKGKSFPPLALARAAEAAKRRGDSFRMSIKEALNRPEVRAKLSERVKALWQDPEYRARRLAKKQSKGE